MRSKLRTYVLAVTIALVSMCFEATAEHPVRQNLLPKRPETLWDTTNSSVESVMQDGEVVYRWHLNAGQEASLAVRQGHTLLGALRYYDYANLHFRIASGELSEMHLRALGHVSGPRQYKVHSFGLGIRTTRRQQWHLRVLELARPNWFPWDNPDGPVHETFFKLDAVALAPDTVIELRGLSLVRGLVRRKPDFLTPVTWPILDQGADGGATYTFRHFLVNSASRPVDIEAEVVSQNERFDVSVSVGRQPGEDRTRKASATDVKNGKKAVFTISGRISAQDIEEVPELYSEKVVLAFRPRQVPDAEILWQGRLTRPLSTDVRGQVILRPEQIKQIRTGMKTGDKKLKSLLRTGEILSSADKFVEKRLVRIPTGHGHVSNNWVGKWRPADRMPEAVNTKTGEKQFDTAIAARTWKEYMANRGKALRHLGYAYLFTGDEKYAAKAIELFGLYASQYTDLNWYNMFGPPWARGPVIGASTRTAASSTYGTNWYFKGHCLLLSAIAESPSWTQEKRQRVYRSFVVPYVTELTKFRGGISNMTDITNRNVLLLGLAFRDANMVRWALRSDPGLLRRLEDITSGGFSSEGRPVNYHYAAMSEYLPALGFLDNAGMAVSFPKDRILAAVRMPYQRATLSGLVPNTGDCGRGVRVNRTHLADHLIGMFPEEKWLFDLGRLSTVPAQLMAHRRDERPDSSGWKELLETSPRLFKGAGYAILRQGDSAEEQIMATLDYGRNPMHAHLDRNQITLSAFGRIFSHGPGSLYNVGSGGMRRIRDRKLESFCGHGSLGQNVIVVDQRNQLKAVGHLLSWQRESGKQVVAARVPSIRPGVDHIRALVLTGGVVVILDRVISKEKHTYDFLYHNLGTLTLGEGWSAEEVSGSLGQTGNYGNLVDPRRLSGKGTVRLRWALTEGAHVALWHAADSGGRFYTAVTGMNNHNKPVEIIPDRAPSLISRVEGKRAHFVTVLEPYRNKPQVMTVEHASPGRVIIGFQFGPDETILLSKLLGEEAR